MAFEQLLSFAGALCVSHASASFLPPAPVLPGNMTLCDQLRTLLSPTCCLFFCHSAGAEEAWTKQVHGISKLGHCQLKLLFF